MAENIFGITHTGRMRDNNEDAFISEKISEGFLLACVIDGVGGYEGGEVAADIARQTILSHFQNVSNDVTRQMKGALLQANRNIYNQKQQGNGNQQMACVLTLAIIDLQQNQFHYAHVGDTRLYLLRDGSLIKLSRDHSFVGFLEDSGRLSEKEAMTHPKRNEINKALGFDEQIEVKDDYIETATSPFLPGDTLMLCSDGLTDLVNAEAMLRMLNGKTSLKQKAEALIGAANEAGGKDNITVVLVSNNNKKNRSEATKPVLIKKNKAPEVATEKKETHEPATVHRKTSSAVVWVLALVCILLAAAAIWLWAKQNRSGSTQTKNAENTYIPNAAEKAFTDSVLLSAGLVTLPASNDAIVIGDTIDIYQDSLHINGNGTILQADSAFKGPVFRVSANCKHFVLENVHFQNFENAVLMEGEGLVLRKVVFENTPWPVQHKLSLPSGNSLSGDLIYFFRPSTDSIPSNQ